MPLPRLLKKSLPSLAAVRQQKADALRDDRVLSDIETEFLMYVLAHGSEEAQSFLDQVRFTRVVSHCGCGCPTVGLQVSSDAKQGHSAGRIIVDLLGYTPDRAQVGVLVFADNGFLSELEVYELDELPHPFPLPTLESLHSFEASTSELRQNDRP